jgi:predicted DsbA family dithiol-disulfide isomerase
MEAGRNLARGRWLSRYAAEIAATIGFAIVIIIVGSLAPRMLVAAEGTANPVVATIGNHKITQQEVDVAVLQNLGNSQLYDLRKQALNKLIDSYIIDQAAKKANLTPAEYEAHAVDGKGDQVTDDDVRKYYDAHKAAIDSEAGGRSYKEIAPLLKSALQRHSDREHRSAFIEKLRADNDVKVMLEEPRVNVASAGHPFTGGKDATVTIVEFSDFQCPYCRAAEPALKSVRSKYGDKIKFVYMDFPLGMHPHAMDAAVAGRCAAEQDKFWQFHDVIFADQTKLDPASLKADAVKVGMDPAKFNACFDAKTSMAGIKADQAEGERIGVSGTPTFFINGREMVGAETEQGFSEVIDDELSHPQKLETQANAH